MTEYDRAGRIKRPLINVVGDTGGASSRCGQHTAEAGLAETRSDATGVGADGFEAAFFK